MLSSLNILYVRAHGLVRAGAMRKLAAYVAESAPDILAVCEIGSGDARALATRFALQWAYRGRQALFWRPVFVARRVADLYLPAGMPLRRPGLVCVDGVLRGIACTLATTQFARSRDPRVAQLRFARTQLRSAKPNVLFFACVTDRSVDFADLAFREFSTSVHAGQHMYVRGFDELEISAILSEL